VAADRDGGPELPAPSRVADGVAERRAPDADGAADRRGPEAAGAADRGPGLRERQLAEHARYRLVVEAELRAEVRGEVRGEASRGAWAAAAPQLRAEWADHKRRHPDQARPPASTQPDGSWHGDGGRRLSPEQHAETAKCAADLRDEARQTIRPAIERVAAADPGRQLAGLQHMLKGEDRLKEKVADALQAPGVTVREALDLVPDAVRFTLVYPTERYADGVLADVERLKAEGFELIKLKNLWHADQYKGVNSQWRRPDTGLRLEMQFHTAESREAKELTHEAYERIRASVTLAASETRELRELKDFQRHVNSLLAVPPGTEKIKEFPEKRDEDRG
jgi:hypothetical protein